MNAASEEWILLKDSKQWSRLLYTNPVCFLCCSSWPTTTATTTGSDNPTTTTTIHHEGVGVDTLRPQTNVMVVSWLTATNNSGGLVLSLNRRRHTVSMLLASLAQSQVSNPTTTQAAMAEPLESMSHTATSSNKPVLFTLSVPIRGTEELIRQVGSVSGRDVNKFPAQQEVQMSILSRQQPTPPPNCNVDNPPYSSHTGKRSVAASIGTSSSCATDSNPPLTASSSNDTASSSPSKRQMKKRLRTMGAIPGLKAVPVALYQNSNLHGHLACIDGTVAQLVCRITTVTPNGNDTDGDSGNDDDAHVLLMAQVEHAAVQSRYWDGAKNLFRPCRPNVPPYLSFFGSQTFGYVVTQDCLENGMGPLT